MSSPFAQSRMLELYLTLSMSCYNLLQAHSSHYLLSRFFLAASLRMMTWLEMLLPDTFDIFAGTNADNTVSAGETALITRRYDRR